VIEAGVSGSELTITAEGDLDLAERAQFPALVALAEADGVDRVVVDLCGVGFVDSSGASFLVQLAARVRRAGGRAVLRGASDGVLYVLQVCGTLAAFDVDATHRCPPTSSLGPWRVDRG
jgi:anti-anti-sigma factor